MVEGEAHIVPEDVIIDALDWGRAQVMPLIEAQDKLVSLCGREKMPFTPHEDDPVLLSRVTELCQENGIREAMCVPDKLERKTARAAVKDKVMAALTNDPAWADKPEALAAVPDMIAALEKKTVRTRIREEGRRIDGRDRAPHPDHDRRPAPHPRIRHFPPRRDQVPGRDHPRLLHR